MGGGHVLGDAQLAGQSGHVDLPGSAGKFEDYPDKDSITAEFTEGVQVLTGLKVFQGDEKGFRPSDKITIVFRPIFSSMR